MSTDVTEKLTNEAVVVIETVVVEVVRIEMVEVLIRVV